MDGGYNHVLALRLKALQLYTSLVNTNKICTQAGTGVLPQLLKNPTPGTFVPNRSRQQLRRTATPWS